MTQPTDNDYIAVPARYFTGDRATPAALGRLAVADYPAESAEYDQPRPKPVQTPFVGVAFVFLIAAGLLVAILSQSGGNQLAEENRRLEMQLHTAAAQNNELRIRLTEAYRGCPQ